ncbi:MAG: prepilin-type N-terminal cleavage/methylation domain-containing protein [Kiritimatiellia bacterium]|nr:prepilin-type N-terminal cleavage/methylation domain-containing protein [Kiritimatiellia bacterium]
MRNASSAGFSLVEISLALLVVGIGMLAILSMFPAGLDQNVRSISDTHAGLFAGEVFSSLRVYAETNWDEIGETILNLPVAAKDNWYNSGSLDIKLDNEIHANVYCHPDNTNIVDHAFRYRITLLTNDLRLIKSASLRFWPGQFGTSSNPAMFYAEFYKMNR